MVKGGGVGGGGGGDGAWMNSLNMKIRDKFFFIYSIFFAENSE